MPEEILSQSEIDALLSALSTGEMNAEEIKKEPAKKIKVYDFKRALRFSKDQIRSLARVHENFARILTTYFSAQLRTYVQINVASVDQVPYEEFVRSVPKLTILTVYDVPPLEGNIIMEINPNIAYSMIDRVLGGYGESINKIEKLTEIEKKIMTRLFEQVIDQLQEAWSEVTEINPVLSNLEVNPQFLQMISPNETVVVISFNTTIGDTTGMINLCLPQVVLDPIIPNLSGHYWMRQSDSHMDPETQRLLEDGIKEAKVPLVVELGSTQIKIEEFLNIELGDVITLNQSIEEPLKLKVDHIPKFIGQPGKVGSKMAVQILNMLTKGDDDHE
ncbi:flagellar motor switch protein FliM [Bacillus ginsengihumi]|uniref:Flagellar motor switch protein FliM n=1 Tax=Heyndrickxia ginsengihumi TaxID=363870 RepID=A0A0A6VIP1_9BACI|nr:flagellar motor switch protein FliM [Heyndrickxia ginsengihumi]KHD86509.1 flagellar motor switch protein FliM [Heyndrickxia ginsengihumi]MBE6182762.1 flagellar motor switch protein FliM [Bacillus sp. (in: firmicutes)]MCM3022502.1 flagellar motor switch protein FliM [Heyndrickxia ginsengihumi]NEY19622.1 flagellar motor switch protein FliM [Heyndrickxia ginsengihumi]